MGKPSQVFRSSPRGVGVDRGALQAAVPCGEPFQPDSRKRLLGKVLSIGIVPSQPPEECKNGGVEPAHEVRRGRHFTTPDPFDQLGFISIPGHTSVSRMEPLPWTKEFCARPARDGRRRPGCRVTC
jgi:hypothetical protein